MTSANRLIRAGSIIYARMVTANGTGYRGDSYPD